MGCANSVFLGGVNGNLRLLVHNQLRLMHTHDSFKLFFAVLGNEPHPQKPRTQSHTIALSRKGKRSVYTNKMHQECPRLQIGVAEYQDSPLNSRRIRFLYTPPSLPLGILCLLPLNPLRALLRMPFRRLLILQHLLNSMPIRHMPAPLHPRPRQHPLIPLFQMLELLNIHPSPPSSRHPPPMRYIRYRALLSYQIP